MKLIICIFLLTTICTTAQSAPSHLDTRIDMLTQQLERLESERVMKMSELTKCEKEVKNFKIAGISTLGLTGVGIGINITLASKLSSAKNGGSGSSGQGGGARADTRSPQQVSNDNKDLFAELGI